MRDKKSFQAFTDAFPKNNAKLPWDELSITEERIGSKPKYVGWVDLMGASTLMLRSPDAASRSIGCLHESVLRAVAPLLDKGQAELHPISDGVYVVSDKYDIVATVLGRAFRSYALKYLKLDSEARSCPIRAAIAYGRAMESTAVRSQFEVAFQKGRPIAIPKPYVENIVQGTAFSAAHEAERKAPPFGIYHDESLRNFGQTRDNGLFVTWPFMKWWCEGREANTRQRRFAECFGRVVLAHFDWIERHPVESGMDGDRVPEKIEKYRKLIREYFGVFEKEQCSTEMSAKRMKQ